MGTAQPRSRIAATAVALAVATCTLQIATATPAQASVSGLQIVSAVSSANSTSPKTIIASCPTGKRVIGTGFIIDGDATQVVLDDLIPTSTSVMATGYEDGDATTGDWWIRAFAVCADPLPGLEIVALTSASSSASKLATATCSSGKRILGSGAAITGGTGQVVLDEMAPGDTTASATAYEDVDGTTANWTVTSYAICAVAPAGLQVVLSTTFPDYSSSQTATPGCPSGTSPLSVGWQINTRYSGTIFPIIAMPSQTDAYVTAGINNTPGLSAWSVTGRVVCATP